MSRYTGRHAARHAAPRRSRRALLRAAAPARGSVSAPVATSAAIFTAALATAVALPSSTAPDSVALTVDDRVVASTAESTAERSDTAERLISERTQLNSSRSTVRAEIEEQEKADAEAAARVKREREERLAQERAEQKAAEERAAVLELSAAQEDPQAVARLLMPEYGFTGEGQWQCLQNLWMGESDWRWWAQNPSSGAYGIPQSLPADKMASAGEDWRTNPVTQIHWGLEYIKLSYGTPCGAWEFWQAQDPHWY